MRKPRTNILLPTTIFVVVGLVGQAWLARESESAPPAGTDFLEAHAVQAAPVHCALVPLQADSADAGASGPRQWAASHPTMPPQPLSDDASVLVVKMCDLHLLADGIDFTLDANQWSAFAAVVLRCQAIRHTYEASIATLKVIAPGQFRVEIPAYARVGDELREQFSAELRTALGEPKAGEVMAKLGGRLEGSFAGFGLSEQTLDITANAAGRPGDIVVTRTARYWDSTESTDRLTTRHETHLPVVEDPTGDNWSALLAMVNAANPKSGPG